MWWRATVSSRWLRVGIKDRIVASAETLHRVAKIASRLHMLLPTKLPRFEYESDANSFQPARL
jgi:hypothetical protein